MRECLHSASWLSDRVPWIPIVLTKAAIKKCRKLKADGYFIAPIKREAESMYREEDVESVFYFTKRPTCSELEEIRECQNYLAEIFSYTQILAALRPVVSEWTTIKIINGEPVFGQKVTWVKVDMEEEKKILTDKQLVR